MLEPLSNICGQISGNRITHRLYGSEAEDLKCYKLGDVGDEDIMIFPTSDNLLIDDELIEYLPEHPLHVRIKGVNHPVLQSCLVGDTEYVATSALKNFHPAIYGIIIAFCLPASLQIITDTDELSTSCLLSQLSYQTINSTTSPAVTLNVKSPLAKLNAFIGNEERKLLENAKPSLEETMHKQEAEISEGSVVDISEGKRNGDPNENPTESKGEEDAFEGFIDSFAHRFGIENMDEIAEQEIWSGIDFVPALRCLGWPRVAREWIKRERKWPSTDVVGEVIHEGIHLVVKPPKDGGNPDCDFRISFSHAEYLLSQEMNDIQRECYRCFKRYHRAYLSTKPKSLVTYHLKTIFLQTIEETGAEFWTESNRVECVMKLFGNLLEALIRNDLPHFFVRSYNLFSNDYIESPEVLESVARKVEQIMLNPMQFAEELIQELESKDTRNVKSGEEPLPVPCSEPPPSVNTAMGQEDAEITETPPIQTEQTASKATANQRGSISIRNDSYHDLKDIFLATCKELTDRAFNDPNCSLEDLDPLEKPLVEGLRELGRNNHLLIELFPLLFEFNWNVTYFIVWMNPEPNVRRRVLAGIKTTVEMLKYIARQPDLAPGNYLSIMRRMMDPSSEDPFNISHIIPGLESAPGFERMYQSAFNFFDHMLQRVSRLYQQEFHMQDFDLDDIPLD